ncbi:MAG TPA: hypothetical protein VGV40_05155 [Solirubrobacteraceae bacterium]|nr:hypothetical protein [Solirubrobacteraceae bacterium]
MSAIRKLVQERPRLAGALLLAAGAVVAIIVLAPGLGGDDGSVRDQDGPTEPLRQAFVPPLGLSLLYPEDWDVRTAGKVLRLSSPEGSVTATFAAPEAPGRTDDVRRALERTIRDALKNDNVLRRARGRLGTEAVDTIEISGRLKAGREVRVLLLAGATAWRTYGVTVTTARQPSQRRVGELAGVLASVELSEPKDVRARKGR